MSDKAIILSVILAAVLCVYNPQIQMFDGF